MSADFWAGYVSGAIGILIGNPLDIIKTKLQAGGRNLPADVSAPRPPPPHDATPKNRWTQFARGSAAPILGYGALNALMFMTYNRTLTLLTTGSLQNSSDPALSPPPPTWYAIWTAGALGGLATFVVSAPTELIKCRAQLSRDPPRSSLAIFRSLWRASGIRGLYMGGGITAVRDSVGYGFYFWSYELSKRAIISADDSHAREAVKVLCCGGLAGVVTWASIFPLDVIKTRVQTWDLSSSSLSSGGRAADGVTRPLLPRVLLGGNLGKRPSSLAVARQAYQNEGIQVFFRGLGVCSARAFVVNAVQWAIYEWMMKMLTKQ